MSLAAILLYVALQGTLQETRVPLADLAGLTVAEVGARTGAAQDIGTHDGVRIVEGGRTLDLYPLRRFRRQPTRDAEACLTGLEREPPEDDSIERHRALAAGEGLIVFENGRLSGVYRDPPAPTTSYTGRAGSLRALQAQMRAPRPPSPLAVAPGRLPLSDGAAALERLEPSSAGTALVSLCRPLPAQTYRSDPGMDFLWGLVGLTVLPAVPFQRAEDARAEREGGGLLAGVEAGADLGMPAERWAGGVRGVRVYRDPVDPGFAVIAVKLGSGVDTVAKVGLLGVRGTTVVWMAERDAADDTGIRALMCRDEHNRATNVRRGCSATGYLIP